GHRGTHLTASRAPPTAHDPAAVTAAEAAKAGPQLIDRARPDSFVLSPRHGKSHGTIEGRQVAWMKSPRLTLLQSQSDNATHARFDIVVHRHAVAIQKDGGGQGIEPMPLRLGNRLIGIERDARGDERIP